MHNGNITTKHNLSRFIGMLFCQPGLQNENVSVTLKLFRKNLMNSELSNLERTL